MEAVISRFNELLAGLVINSHRSWPVSGVVTLSAQYERVASSPLLFKPNMHIGIMPIEVTIDFASYSYYETRRASPLPSLLSLN